MVGWGMEGYDPEFVVLEGPPLNVFLEPSPVLLKPLEREEGLIR